MTLDPVEEARAQLWRDEQLARARAAHGRQVALTGDPAAAVAFRDAWTPILTTPRRGRRRPRRRWVQTN